MLLATRWALPGRHMGVPLLLGMIIVLLLTSAGLNGSVFAQQGSAGGPQDSADPPPATDSGTGSSQSKGSESKPSEPKPDEQTPKSSKDESEPVIFRTEAPEPVPVENWTVEGAFRDRVIAGHSFTLTQFGYELFSQGTFSDPSRRAAGAPTPSDYNVGPDDELVIHITGTVFETHRVTVDADGRALLPKAGPVPVWGITFGQVRQLIAEELRQYYAGVEVGVALGQPRSVAVHVLGEVASPGRYDLSGFSTVMHGLLAAGGIVESGSLRNVQVLRDGEKAASIDLYDLLLKGAETAELRLRDGDILFVPPVGPVVGIAGEVRRPAIYELKVGETLQDLVQYAGGLARSANTAGIRIERFSDEGRRSLVEVTLPRSALDGVAPPEDGTDLALTDHDLVYVPHVDVARESLRLREVRLHGNVQRPGVYEWHEGLTVGGLIERAGGPLGETVTGRGEIYRYLSDDTRQVVPFDVERALAADPEHDFSLNEWDEVHVYSARDVTPEPLAFVAGAVHRPGGYPLTPGMRVRDLLFRAGEPTEAAHLGRVELYRTVRTLPDALRRVDVLDLEALLGGDESHNLLLRPDDVLVVYDADTLAAPAQVHISGYVAEEGYYELSADMRLSDLVARAGGATAEALDGRVEIFRLDGQGRRSIITVDTALVMERVLRPWNAGGSEVEWDPPLLEGDRVFVRGVWEKVTDRTVVLTGAVRYPGAYGFAPGDTLENVIARAGGFVEGAYEYGIVFTRETLREKHSSLIPDLLADEWQAIERERQLLELMPLAEEERERRSRALEHRAELVRVLEGRTPEGRIILDVEDGLAGTAAARLRLQDGDEIHVPEHPEAVIVTGAVYMPEAVLYVPDQTPDYYLRLVGGPTPGTSADDMYVVKANGRVETKYTGFTAVRQGDVVVIPFRTDKEGSP